MAGTADGPLRRRASSPIGAIEAWLARQHPVSPGAATPGAAATNRPVALLVAGGSGRQDMRRRLAPHYHVIAAGLTDAAGILGDAHLDLIVIDATLPEPDLMQLITLVRVHHWLRGTPIIAYAAPASEVPISRMAALAAHDFIVEPVSTDEFVARIDAQLSRPA